MMTEEQYMGEGKGSVLMGFGKIHANEPFRRQMGNKEKHLQLQLCLVHHPGAGHRLPNTASFWKCSSAKHLSLVLVFIQM